MIVLCPPADAPLDQGDILDGCPVLSFNAFTTDDLVSIDVATHFHRVIVLTQTCDLDNQKTTLVTVAVVHDVVPLIASGLLRAADVRGPVRAGRVFGWYYLPEFPDLGLPESVVDLHDLHTVPRSAIHTLIAAGKRRGRLQPLYREHLGKHFGDTYSRIGLPHPYPTRD